jgi:hypothetical protein
MKRHGPPSAANNPNWVHGDHFEPAIEHHITAPRFGAQAAQIESRSAVLLSPKPPA